MNQKKLREVKMTSKLSIFQKLVEVRKKVVYIQKSTKSPQSSGGRRIIYAATSDLLGEIREELDRQGIVILTNITEFEIVSINGKDCPQAWVTHTWINAEDPSDRIEMSLCFVETAQSGCQSSGAILTYAERYMLYKNLQIATDEADPDAYKSRFETEGDTLVSKVTPIEPKVTPIVSKTNAAVEKRQTFTLSDVQASALSKVIWCEIETRTKKQRPLDPDLAPFLQDVQKNSPDFDIWRSVEKMTRDPEFFLDRLAKWKEDNKTEIKAG